MLYNTISTCWTELASTVRKWRRINEAVDRNRNRNSHGNDNSTNKQGLACDR